MVQFGPKPRSPESPLPLEAIRDLIGICRALYAARSAAGATPQELEHISYIGGMLRNALELGRGAQSHSKRYRDAWTSAEEGVAALGWHLGRDVPLRPLVDAASRRITGANPPGPEPPPHRRKLG